MGFAETNVLREEWEVGARLAELRTSREQLLRVRAVALGAAADATAFHPVNSPGTFSYQHGTFALRREHAGKDEWKPERPNGVEAVSNDAMKVRFVFANVDVACNDFHQPRARSDKGAGAERLCAENSLFGHLPHFTKTPAVHENQWVTYYLMVASNGAVELSRPTIENGRFKTFIERIYLSDGSDFEDEPKLHDDVDVVDVFDPHVARK